jgi:hypothetical protein
MNLKLSFKMCAVVMAAGLYLQTSSVMAAIITTDQMAPKSQLETDKLKIQTFMDRAEVKDQLQALGVDEFMSKVRVAAMTDQEVHEMALNIDSMPAGGRLHDSDLLLILLIVLLILLI